MSGNVSTNQVLVTDEAGKCRLGNGYVARLVKTTDNPRLRKTRLVAVIEIKDESFVVEGKVLLFQKLLLPVDNARQPTGARTRGLLDLWLDRLKKKVRNRAK